MLEAAGAEVDNFDTTPSLVLQKDILRLEIAVDDSIAVEQLQTEQDGVCKLSYQRQAEADVLALLDQFVQVHAEKLERDADVVSEAEELVGVDDVVRAVAVLLLEVFQDLDLLLGLAVEALLVAHDLQCHVVVGFVVVDLEYLHAWKRWRKEE